MGISLQSLFLNVENGTRFDEWENLGVMLVHWQQNVNWWIGDAALHAERMLKPEQQEAYWPPYASPGLVARCKAVAAAYPPSDRNTDATWSIHMKHAGAPNRVALVQAAVDAGQTTDENRARPAMPAEAASETPSVIAGSADTDNGAGATMFGRPFADLEGWEREWDLYVRSRMDGNKPEDAVRDPSQWLLAVDVNGWLASFFHAGAETEAAGQFVQWLQNLVRRLRGKGLTQVVCALDSPQSHRKTLTQHWESPYKSGRTQKNNELQAQIHLVETLLQNRGADVWRVDGWEADDVLASYAAQFQGRVTLVTKDKDMRQCLGPGVNLLTEVTWSNDPDTQESMPTYNWITADKHVAGGVTYGSAAVKGITPTQWPHFQAIAGDSSDTIKGVDGIGGTGAADLIRQFGSIRGVLNAVANNASGLTQKKRDAVRAFEPRARQTLALTLLREDLWVPTPTTINLQNTEPDA